MKHVAWLVLAWLLLSTPVHAAAVDELSSSADRRRLDLESFDHVWTTIRDRHWDPEMGGIDWNAIRDELRPGLEQAATTSEARAAMDEMIASLGLSHYAVIPAEIYEELGLPDGEGALDGSTGIDLRVIDREALVTSVVEGSPAADSGVRPGWTVVRVGQEPLAPVFETLAGEFAGGLYEDLVLASAAKIRLSGPVGKALAVEFRDSGGKTEQIELVLREERGRKVQVGYLPPLHVWFGSERIDGTIGYITFSMFIDPAGLMPAFNDAMASFMDSEGIVIDLRGNPGGLPMMAMGMAGWLIAEKDHYLGTMITRENRLKIVVFPRPTIFTGPVAVLVDGLSGSCSEIFAGGLKDLGRARIFGSRTMGATLPSVIEQLPNGDGFQYAVADYLSRGGTRLEGVGVAPDVEARPSREALLDGRDAALEAAIAWIHEQSQ